MPRILRTERLRLVPTTASHLDSLVDIQRRNADAFEGKVVRVLTHVREAQRWLVQSPTALRYTVVLAQSKTVLGMISLTNIAPLPQLSASLGYWMDTQHSGQGYMREASRAVVTHGFKTLKLHRIEASIEPRNRRSIKLVKALGFELEGTSRKMLFLCGAWRDQKRFALRAEQWTS